MTSVSPETVDVAADYNVATVEAVDEDLQSSSLWFI